MSGSPFVRCVGLDDAWVHTGRVLASAHDILVERTEDGEAPEWCVARGWGTFLSRLSDEATSLVERKGLSVLTAFDDAPGTLTSLARAIDDLTQVGAFRATEALGITRGRRASDRKWAQVAAFASACEPLAHACERIVDVGSGHGHLTRSLATAFAREAHGFERDATRVLVAGKLANEAPARGVIATFEQRDVMREGLGLTARDLGVGLHACGDLGDQLIDEAAAVGASVALVSCCLQKTRADVRAPRNVPDAVRVHDLTWPRAVLGLSNLASRSEGVEASLEHNLRARENRHAVRWLLAARGVDRPVGAELTGVNRRRAHASLADLTARVFASLGLAPASASELNAASKHAALSYARARRYALPRNALGRLMEVFVLYDRARFLASRGYVVRVGHLFDATFSPRNLALLAARTGTRGAFGV